MSLSFHTRMNLNFSCYRLSALLSISILISNCMKAPPTLQHVHSSLTYMKLDNATIGIDTEKTRKSNMEN